MAVQTSVVVLWLAGLAAGAVGLLTWRKRPTPGTTPLSLTMGAAAVWIGAITAGLLASTRSGRLFWANIEWVAVLVLPLCWLWFCLEYAGRTSVLTRRNKLLSVFVLLGFLLFIWTDGIVHSMFRQRVDEVTFGNSVLLETTPGPVYWLVIAYVYASLTVGVLVLTELWLDQRLTDYRQTAVLIVAAVLPSGVGIGYVAGLVPDGGVDPTPVVVAASGVLIIGAVTQFDLFEQAPVPERVARAAVIEAMDDGVLVVDQTDRIVDINPHAASIIGCSTTGAIGRCASEHVPGYDMARTSDGDTTVTADRNGLQRQIDVRITPFRTKGRDGAVVVLRDVTEDRRREQRLDVLNRVLRHNLRNDLNVVYGFAEQLEANEEYDSKAVELIKDRTQSLLSTGEKARAIEAFLDRDQTGTVNVATLLDHEVERLRKRYDDVEVTVRSLPEETHCQRGVSAVVRDLLENAAQHNTSNSPAVRVTARRHGQELVIEISDNGPGLPENERVVLESGQETPLEHGSGLGLWLVAWGIRELNGVVEFDDSDEEGCTVIVRVPVCSDAASSESYLSHAATDNETDETGCTSGQNWASGPD